MSATAGYAPAQPFSPETPTTAFLRKAGTLCWLEQSTSTSLPASPESCFGSKKLVARPTLPTRPVRPILREERKIDTFGNKICQRKIKQSLKVKHSFTEKFTHHSSAKVGAKAKRNLEQLCSPVHVLGDVLWQVVVDDVDHVPYIEPPGRDRRGHKDGPEAMAVRAIKYTSQISFNN